MFAHHVPLMRNELSAQTKQFMSILVPNTYSVKQEYFALRLATLYSATIKTSASRPRPVSAA